MNELDTRDGNDAIIRDSRDDRPIDRNMENPPKPHPPRRRRWGGRLFALGGSLLLAGGLSLGAWANYSRQQQVMTTAKQERDFVPTVSVATVEVSPGIMSVTLPGTTAAFAAANIFARATGYIAKRNVDIGDQVKAGDLLAELAVRKTKRRSVSSSQRWSRRRPTESSRT
jgi:multidrug efflux pump subunit AcrA (membrane-fusion protein)